jgi:hypothetical protein
MGSRRSPSGPQSFLTGFIALDATAVGSSTAQATVTAIARILVGPAGTAAANMNGRIMSSNDVVSVSPRVTPLSSVSGAPVSIAYARVVSVEAATISTAVAIIQVALQNSTNTLATTPANTYDLAVTLRSADL